MQPPSVNDVSLSLRSAPLESSLHCNANSFDSVRQVSRTRSFSPLASLHTASSSQPTTLALSTSLHMLPSQRDRHGREFSLTNSPAALYDSLRDSLSTPSRDVSDLSASGNASGPPNDFAAAAAAAAARPLRRTRSRSRSGHRHARPNAADAQPSPSPRGGDGPRERRRSRSRSGHRHRHRRRPQKNDGTERRGGQEGGEQEGNGQEDRGNGKEGHRSRGHVDKGHDDNGHEDIENEEKQRRPRRHVDKGHGTRGHVDKGHEDNRHEDVENEEKQRRPRRHVDKGHGTRGHVDKGHEDNRHEDVENEEKQRRSRRDMGKGHGTRGHVDKGHEGNGREDIENENKERRSRRDMGKGHGTRGHVEKGQEDNGHEDKGNENREQRSKGPVDKGEDNNGRVRGVRETGGVASFVLRFPATGSSVPPRSLNTGGAEHPVYIPNRNQWSANHNIRDSCYGEDADESLLVPCGMMDELPQPRRAIKRRDLSRDFGDGNFVQFSPQSMIDESMESLHASEEESSESSETLTPRWAPQPCASCCVDYSDREGWRKQRPRRHAFQWPLHHLQISAISVTTVIVALFCSSVLPPYTYLYSGGFGYAEFVVTPLITAFAVLCMGAAWFTVCFIENGDIEGEGEPCGFCQRLTSLTSRHCKACNKCITGFDHHCKWLNMCIGKKNYRFFILYAVSTLVALIAVLISAVLMLSRWWAELTNLSLYFRVASVLMCVLVVLVIIPLGQLLCFHAMLRWLGISTYDYLMRGRRRASRQ